MSDATLTVVGSINLDLVARCEHLPQAGETVLGGVYAEHPGGKGANQALAARRLGANVQMVGRVGRDANAETALALLKRDGVDLSAVRVSDDAPTGVALIAVSESGENQIVVAPGANADIMPGDLPDRMEGGLLGQLETPVETLMAALDRGPVFSCINLAPAADVPADLLRRSDLLVVNEVEADFYGLEALHASGGMIAMTLGSKGAVLFSNGQEIARAAPPAVTPVDTTGAGDTFCGALSVALLEGMSEDKALTFACAAGAASTLKEGAQPALPRRDDVIVLMGG